MLDLYFFLKDPMRDLESADKCSTELADVSLADSRISRVRESDVDAVVDLVHELAEYEKTPQECQLTADQLRTALFGAAPA